MNARHSHLMSFFFFNSRQQMFTIITDIYKSIHAAVNKGSQCFFPILLMDFFNDRLPLYFSFYMSSLLFYSILQAIPHRSTFVQ